jgi:MbtH protein
MQDTQDTEIFDVVINDEAQYSIWRRGQELPAGWRGVGFNGPKDECLAYIDENWTDMRPLSVRQAMDAPDA